MAEIVRPEFRRHRDQRRARRPRRRLFDTPIPVTLILCVSLAIALYAMNPSGMLGLKRDAPLSVLDSPQIHVVDGDTVRSGERTFRLVGFNTPETGDNARCAEERALAARATARLQELVAAGRTELERRPCACKPGHRRNRGLQLRQAVREALHPRTGRGIDPDRRGSRRTLCLRRHLMPAPARLGVARV